MIIKELKNASFKYDEELHIFGIATYVDDELISTITFSKVYAFAFVRFVLRIAQRNFLRKIKNV